MAWATVRKDGAVLLHNRRLEATHHGVHLKRPRPDLPFLDPTPAEVHPPDRYAAGDSPPGDDPGVPAQQHTITAC